MNDLTSVFTLSSSGVYQVILGIYTNEIDQFDIELNGVPVSGGRSNIVGGTVINILTVMFTAVAGDTLEVKNTGGGTALLGQGDPGGVTAFISTLQIN